MGFLKRLLGGELDVDALRRKGDVRGLIAALDHSSQQEKRDSGNPWAWGPSSTLIDTIVAFGKPAIDLLATSSRELSQQAQNAVLQGDPRSAGALINNRRFRIEVLARLADPAAIRPLLDAVVDGIEISHVPQGVTEMFQAQTMEMMRQASFGDRPLPRPDLRSVRVQGDIVGLTLPGRWLAEAACDGLVHNGPPVIPIVVGALPQVSPQSRSTLLGVLAAIGGQDAKAAIEGLLGDPDEGVRARAKEVLAQM
jgi:hypothetical protein